jgi:putative PIN family toxin of toxin-antitoxin system
MRVVIDTNVFIAALLSPRGTSSRVIELIGDDLFEVVVSVPLVLEYESIALRLEDQTGLSRESLGDILDYICTVAYQQKVFYLWRPFLRDPKDDMILELAVAGRAEIIITSNLRDFAGVSQFGIEPLLPVSFS